MEVSEFLQTVEALHREARDRGLFFQDVTDARLSGRGLTVGDRRLLSFGSCSYLGLEFHPLLAQGARDALERYGTQFSSSRGYLSAPPYAELEAMLDELFGGHTVVTGSTTLGHLAAFDVLATEKDAVVLDHQVHQSVHQAVTLARSRGTHVAVVRHEDLARAEEVVAALARKHDTVWFATDGVTSMYGDVAPVALLERLLAIAPNVRLYIDDAHGMSWAGRHGRGSFLSRMALGERTVVATSLNKAFAAGGGCLVFPTAKERDRVRMCGGTMTFAGPLQPPMLGAAVASARLHLSDEITALQGTLADRVALTNRLLREHALPLLVENEAPIFFLRVGLPRAANEVAQRMAADGIYVNISMYPTVPMRRAGIRVSINATHTPDQIEALVEALARHMGAVLEEEGVTREDLDALFAKAVVSHLGTAPASTPAGDAAPKTPEDAHRRLESGIQPTAFKLQVDHHRTIAAVDRDEWNRLLGGAGTCSWESLQAIERLYSGQARVEHNWLFDYVIVRDAAGQPLCATHFTTGLQKDDFLMRDEVSRAVESRRKDEPYFLTSRVVMMGSALSEGNHLYLDRGGAWRPALERMLRVAHGIYEREKADALMLRDLPADDVEMDDTLRHHGFLKVPMLDSHVLDVTWRDEAEYLAQLSFNHRRQIRKYVLRYSERYERTVYGHGAARLAPEDVRHLHELYRSVASRKLRLNVFELPPSTLDALMDCPSWEIVTLRLRGPDGVAAGPPVAWYAAHKYGGDYAPFFCGLDYEHVGKHDSAYRQMVLEVTRRARELGALRVHMGMDADTEKLRFGTRVQRNCVYVQAREHWNATLLRDIVAEVGLARASGGDAPGAGAGGPGRTRIGWHPAVTTGPSAAPANLRGGAKR